MYLAWSVGADAKIANCTIVPNTTNGAGGGIFHELGTSLELVNSILWGNLDEYENAGFWRHDFRLDSVLGRHSSRSGPTIARIPPRKDRWSNTPHDQLKFSPGFPVSMRLTFP